MKTWVLGLLLIGLGSCVEDDPATELEAAEVPEDFGPWGTQFTVTLNHHGCPLGFPGWTCYSNTLCGVCDNHENRMKAFFEAQVGLECEFQLIGADVGNVPAVAIAIHERFLYCVEVAGPLE